MNHRLEGELLEIARQRFVEFCELRPVPESIRDRLGRSWQSDGHRLLVDVSMQVYNEGLAGLEQDGAAMGMRHLVRLTVDAETRECTLTEITSPCW